MEEGVFSSLLVGALVFSMLYTLVRAPPLARGIAQVAIYESAKVETGMQNENKE
tara:strand:+ start:270 stop:431 length:162 start_codon:yes stop_codon:yes gene_type:complete